MNKLGNKNAASSLHPKIKYSTAFVFPDISYTVRKTFALAKGFQFLASGRIPKIFTVYNKLSCSHTAAAAASEYTFNLFLIQSKTKFVHNAGKREKQKTHARVKASASFSIIVRRTQRRNACIVSTCTDLFRASKRSTAFSLNKRES